jgi:5-aminolevulinate synthase
MRHRGRRHAQHLGQRNHHKQLEAELADLHHKEDALLFTSGYVSNWAALSTLGARLPNAVILSDALNHASMIEGIRHAKLPEGHLEAQRSRGPGPEARRVARPAKIVAFESVYSMDGDIAPIKEISTSATSTGR